MNVLFLDYDGVVNTPQWMTDANNKPICRYAYPSDETVNDYQAVQWVSEFCEKFGYSIVVTSTWRLKNNYQECLRNGGLRSGIEILGAVPVVDGVTRGEEIRLWLSTHPEVENFIIFDDENVDEYQDHHVKCDLDGFGFREFEIASRMVRDGGAKANRMPLTDASVVEIADKCCYRKSTLKDILNDNPLVQIVDGPLHTVIFNPAAVAEYADDIKEMLAQLPDSFKEGYGGGDRFVRMFHDKYGTKWTNEPSSMELLCCLGLASGYLRPLVPFWVTRGSDNGIILVNNGSIAIDELEYCIINSRMDVELVRLSEVYSGDEDAPGEFDAAGITPS